MWCFGSTENFLGVIFKVITIAYKIFVRELCLSVMDKFWVLFECEFAIGIRVMQGDFISVLFNH